MPSRSRSSSRTLDDDAARRSGASTSKDAKMEVDEKGKAPELKIKGQAEAEKKKSKWDEQGDEVCELFLSRC